MEISEEILRQIQRGYGLVWPHFLPRRKTVRLIVADFIADRRMHKAVNAFSVKFLVCIRAANHSLEN